MPGSNSLTHEGYFHFTDLEIKEVISVDEVIDACKCKTFKTCKWSNETSFELAELPKESQLWKEKFQIFNRRICDRTTRSVYCCYDDEIPPTDHELKILINPEKYLQNQVYNKGSIYIRLAQITYPT